jgi:hypothetical protein
MWRRQGRVPSGEVAPALATPQIRLHGELVESCVVQQGSTVQRGAEGRDLSSMRGGSADISYRLLPI